MKNFKQNREKKKEFYGCAGRQKNEEKFIDEYFYLASIVL